MQMQRSIGVLNMGLSITGICLIAKDNRNVIHYSKQVTQTKYIECRNDMCKSGSKLLLPVT